jgi:hypothetical protein
MESKALQFYAAIDCTAKRALRKRYAFYDNLCGLQQPLSAMAKSHIDTNASTAQSSRESRNRFSFWVGVPRKVARNCRKLQ